MGQVDEEWWGRGGERGWTLSGEGGGRSGARPRAVSGEGAGLDPEDLRRQSNAHTTKYISIISCNKILNFTALWHLYHY